MAYQYHSIPELNLDEMEDLTDESRLVAIAGNLIEADSAVKYVPSRQWLENFFYFHGLRSTAARYVAPTITGNNQLVFPQKPVGGIEKNITRRISKTFKAVQVQAANITRQRASIKVWPANDQDEVMIKRAKLSNIMLDFSWQFDNEDDLYYQSILWALMTPAVARKDYLDYSFAANRIYPKTTQGFDPVTGQPTAVPALNEQGQPILEQHPWNKTDIIPATRLMMDFNSTWMHDIEWIGDYSFKRFQWVKQNYLRDEPYYFPQNVMQIKPGPWKFTYMMAWETSLKSLHFGTSPSWSRGPSNLGYGFPYAKDMLTHINFFLKPSPNYPNGREIAVANGWLVYDGPSRAYIQFPMNWHPYSITCYERVPCRVWGTTYAEKITDINRAYEQARTEQDQLRRTFSKPKMAMPIGCQIERDTVTGDEEIYRYNPFGPDGGKINFLTPPQPPTTIIDDLKLTSADFTEMSGVTEINLGIRPQGVSTYRGLEVLREESANVQNNFIRMHENFIMRSQYLKLENIRKSLKNPDYNLANAIRVFKRMSQYITDIDIQNFTGEDLGGFVQVEPLSTIAKSRLALQEKYMALAQGGLLGDVINDPDLNAEFKRKMDIVGFDRPQDKQVLYARYENQQMLTAESMQQVVNPPVYEFHDDAIHIREIENLLLDPALQDKQFIIASLNAHKQAHQQSQAIKIQKQIQNQQLIASIGLGGPPPQGGPGLPPGPGGPGSPPPGPHGPPPGQAHAPPQGLHKPQNQEGGTLFGPATGFSNEPQA